jgi:hypothetical protein
MLAHLEHTRQLKIQLDLTTPTAQLVIVEESAQSTEWWIQMTQELISVLLGTSVTKVHLKSQELMSAQHIITVLVTIQ